MANINSSAPEQTETAHINLVDDKTNPFVGKDFTGFEPIKVTISKAKKAKEKADKEAAGKTSDDNEFYKPLQPGESLWDEDISRIRRHNIIGGWA